MTTRETTGLDMPRYEIGVPIRGAGVAVNGVVTRRTGAQRETMAFPAPPRPSLWHRANSRRRLFALLPI
jgi:hypothetical protein